MLSENLCSRFFVKSSPKRKTKREAVWDVLPHVKINAHAYAFVRACMRMYICIVRVSHVHTWHWNVAICRMVWTRSTITKRNVEYLYTDRIQALVYERSRAIPSPKGGKSLTKMPTSRARVPETWIARRKCARSRLTRRRSCDQPGKCWDPWRPCQSSSHRWPWLARVFDV